LIRQEATAAVSVERFFQLSLLGLVTSGYLAVAGSGYLDAPTIALTGAGLLLRGLLVASMVRLEISERATTAATLAYAGFFLVDYFLLTREFLGATVHLVFFLAVLKTLTARSRRDYLYTAAIAFLELLAAAILSVNFNFFLFLALYLLFGIASLTSAEIRRELDRTESTARGPRRAGGLKRFHTRLALLSSLVTLGILTLTAGWFFLLPRTADAAFARLIRQRIHIPGFSNQVTLGEIGSIQTSSRAVMHIGIFSREIPGALKWRGGALTEFDGKRWSNPQPVTETLVVSNGHVELEPTASRRPGRHINYHIDVGDLDTDALFFAGTPQQVDLRRATLLRTDSGSYRLGQRPVAGIHYDAYSLLEDPPEREPLLYPTPVLSADERQRYLQRPPLDPRIPALALAYTSGAATDLERARDIERRLRSDYAYTLELPAREAADPLAYFLFTRKKGHCEYLASAMTILLRTLGVPARLATGFQSGVYNPMTDLWLVRASDAHTWVEAWIPGRGWSTFDPTPPDPSRTNLGLFAKFALYLDAADTFWQEWVVSYDPGHQGTLADKLEQGARRLDIRWFDSLSGAETDWTRRMAAWFRRFGPRIAIALALAVWIWLAGPPLIRRLRLRLRVGRVRRGQATVADATVLYVRMLHILKRHGYHKPAWFTPAEFAAGLPAGDLSAAVAEFTISYNALRFGSRTEVATRLSTILDALERGGQ